MAINILDEVVAALVTKFKLPVYDSNVEAGFERPCFAVYIPNLYSNPELFKHTRRNYLVIIKYYPKKAVVGDIHGDDERAQCVSMLEQSEMWLDYDKPFDFPITNRRSTITDYDQTLNIKFNAKFRVKYEADEGEEPDYMRILKQRVFIKYGKEK